MAANTSPIHPLLPKIGRARIAAANTARDGSGSLSDLFTAGANGALVNSIRISSSQATAAASSTMVIVIYQTDSAGTNPRKVVETLMTAATPNTTTIGAFVQIDFMNSVTTNGTTITNNGFYGGLRLGPTEKLQISQTIYAGVQDQNDALAHGGDY